MARNRQQPTYNLRDLADLVKKELMLSLNCHALATIQSFDPDKQTVKASILYKQAYEQRDPRSGKYGRVLVDYPILVDCPAIILGGGGGSITFPIVPGDNCVILFNDRDMDNWFAGAPNGDLNSSRMHSMADGIALIGVRSLQDSLADYDADRVAVSYRAGGVVLGKIGVKDRISIQNAAVDFKTEMDALFAALETAGAALAAASSFPQVQAAGAALATAVSLVQVQMDLLLETEGP